MNASAEHLSYWSMRLLVLLQKMASKQTNAVLHLLADVDQLQMQCHYPESGLLFADDHWRAFYHCHETESDNAEHGHFHLFTRLDDQQWAHVAGLSVDNEGQPLRWFAVNRWVTDGPWLEVEKLAAQLDTITMDAEEDDLTSSWLAIMLQLYRDDLLCLLKTREEQVELHLQGRDREATLDDRELYTLSTQDIDLSRMLENHLLYKRGSGHNTAEGQENRLVED